MTKEHQPEHVKWQKSEERFRLMVESVRDYAIFMLDTEGYIVSWNDGARRLKGYEAHEVIGSHFSRFYPPEDLAWQKPQYELERATIDGRFEDEGWRVRKDGTRFWANVVITALRDPETGELCGFGKVSRDLTERKQAEERLRQSEEQFRLLVEGVREYAIFMLDPTGHIATWNSGAEKLKGYSIEEIIGEHFERFYPPEEQVNGKPARLLKQALQNGSVRDQGVRMKKDGSTFHADVLITAVYDSTGHLLGFSKVTRDITDQIRSRETAAARIAAEKASKAKDDFLAVLSHELRTPLTPVLATVGFLTENIATLSQRELLDSLATIHRNTLLEAQLIDDLLDLTRISRGKIELRFEAVDVHAAVQDVLAICQVEIALRDLKVSCKLEAQEHWVWADPTRIRQVFWNLLTNAVKFTRPGGLITVRSASSEDGKFCIDVTDTGIGIEPEQASRIFNAFEQGERTVTRQFGGLGLGLAITRSLVELHHGSISVHSEGKGCGATFRVFLSTIPRTSTIRKAVETARELKTPSLRILLVDDHEDTRGILARLLVRDGHQVEVAGRVESALSFLSTVRFDVLVSDIGLPDGSGHELMIKARKQQSPLRGIALSGFGMEEDINRSTQAGFDCHLTKPVDISVLRESLLKISASLRVEG